MTTIPSRVLVFVVVVVVATTLLPLSTALSDTLTRNQSLGLGETLVSSGEAFELGLFRPGSSGWYLGIWYRKIRVRTYVWIANRDDPLTNSTAELGFLADGNVALVNDLGRVKWRSNHTGASVNSPSLRLLDSGNLVVVAAAGDGGGDFLWQSFDHPTDTLLPDMRLGWDRSTGVDRYLSSWRSPSDPGRGEFSFRLEHRGFPEIFLRSGGDVVKYRSGPWNGKRFSGVPEMAPISGIRFSFVAEPEEVYYSFSISDTSSLVSRLTVSPSGNLERYTWMEERGEWNRFWYAPKDQCDEYRTCGGFGFCDANASPVCRCPRGFGPRDPGGWELRDGSGGCVRRTPLGCGGGRDGFVKMRDMKLPESSGAAVDRNATVDECRRRCLEDCNCTAYSAADISGGGGGTGCVTWRGDLEDLRNYGEGGQVLYVRLAASDLGKLFYAFLFF